MWHGWAGGASSCEFRFRLVWYGRRGLSGHVALRLVLIWYGRNGELLFGRVSLGKAGKAWYAKFG